MACLRPAAVAVALSLSVVGCGLVSADQSARGLTLALPATRPAVLVVITDQESSQAQRATRSLILASARQGERIVVLSDRNGAVLESSVAPSAPTTRVSGPPASLSADPTSFQKARYAQAMQKYQKTVRQARLALRERQQQRLASWVRSVAAAVSVQAAPRTAVNEDLAASLGVAAAEFSSLRQSGASSVAGKVIAIIGAAQDTAQSAPIAPAGLQGSTVVMSNFSGSSDEEGAWQDALLQGGAARAVLLTPATDDQFATVVLQGLDGAVTDTLTSILFGLGQSQLAPAALPQLRGLLRLLTVKYPHATATINGYTDDLPAPGGNLLLSQERAQRVEGWLLAHHVADSRLQAVGYGDSDPVAPNTATGQPLNRRVVVVIDPATVR
jgi:outer membrane protein OmpA-like peptidoglycan-associated protein